MTRRSTHIQTINPRQRSISFRCIIVYFPFPITLMSTLCTRCRGTDTARYQFVDYGRQSPSLCTRPTHDTANKLTKYLFSTLSWSVLFVQVWITIILPFSLRGDTARLLSIRAINVSRPGFGESQEPSRITHVCECVQDVYHKLNEK